MTPPAMAPPSELDEVSLSEFHPVNSAAVTFLEQEKDGRDSDDREQDDREREDPLVETTGGDEEVQPIARKGPSNVYVLAIAFGSFFVFVVVQMGFALIANSTSLLADSAAMMVDAATYLFNLIAERIKAKRARERAEGVPQEDAPRSPRCLEEEETGILEGPGVAQERQARPSSHGHRGGDDDAGTQNLYLELIPPALSVIALMVVTSLALQKALGTLHPSAGEPSAGPVNLTILLSFSSVNLLLDCVNVFCFSRIKKNLFGLENLNVCSAWTHVLADTMRSIAVLLAAAIASIFTTIPPAKADAVAAVVVSAIILVSVIRLVQGIIMTAVKAVRSSSSPPPQDAPLPSPAACATCSVRAPAAADAVQDPTETVEPASGTEEASVER